MRTGTTAPRAQSLTSRFLVVPATLSPLACVPHAWASAYVVGLPIPTYPGLVLVVFSGIPSADFQFADVGTTRPRV